MPFNGPGRELSAGDDHLDGSVYCAQCGTIFLPAGTRACPACTLAERLDELEERHRRANGEVGDE